MERILVSPKYGIQTLDNIKNGELFWVPNRQKPAKTF